MTPLALMQTAPVIPVLAFDNVEQAIEQSKALVAGGLPVLEITLRTASAIDCIKAVAAEVEGAIVGAGTVLNPNDLERVVEAGAQFAVSPGATDTLWRAAEQSPVPLLAGVASVSDIMRGMEFGHTEFKFFPAEINGGVAAIKAFGGPLKGVSFCPTGGVKPANLADYLALDNVVCVGGTWLTPKDADPMQIEFYASDAVKMARAAGWTG
ncbi:bifunctional 4-hydroxy-2-oxoglutarate aldolase/2-dehydro-3-deoxy-phosphogluconate aldolase [Litorivicinus lipolyticus]|uniref:2-dehydro-3-deoxy-phosphogluconate aldolase n=1 Tax=Litorivicinus lipolyticus TaxID=418701 RepID=A0A5Q2QA00_9GAMM|nr:bifunctional 4-hydroxy-2-oxoglutarate aldolase/2-dehydro-3-deoxy-phosphogluconate aldolase [Litorivicinus lipolyticus]QGG79794.1 bifunctional 4-hydroxy-2-oxoglutarate aldolase/2-dehydro-3-deoxy-phosphogluconate aldolase [Litorivicinus lipolyticus]